MQALGAKLADVQSIARMRAGRLASGSMPCADLQLDCPRISFTLRASRPAAHQHAATPASAGHAAAFELALHGMQLSMQSGSSAAVQWASSASKLCVSASVARLSLRALEPAQAAGSSGAPDQEEAPGSMPASTCSSGLPPWLVQSPAELDFADDEPQVCFRYHAQEILHLPQAFACVELS